MTDMISVGTAVERILAQVTELERERVHIESAFGRVLAENVDSPLDLPPFDNSAMDGYAVRAHDTQNSPVTLRVVDDIPAGRASTRTIGPGETARIMTGAPIPAGADAVVPVELTSANWGGRPGTGGASSVSVNAPVQTGDSVRLRGENVRKSQRLLSKSAGLRPQDVGLLATMGMSSAAVIWRPKAAILTSGDELIPHNEPIPARGIYKENSSTRAALLAQ